jgi:Zn-dependent protease
MLTDTLRTLWTNFPVGLIAARLVVVSLSFTLHELAHGLAAAALGDPTGREARRLTLNPLPHQEPIGWLAGVLVGVGWSRPVPTRPHRMRVPSVLGGSLTVLAGPLASLGVVLGGQAIFRSTALAPTPIWHDLPSIAGWLTLAVRFNLMIVLINLLPLFPLDAWQLIRTLLPLRAASWWQRAAGITTTVLGVALGLLLMLPVPLAVRWLGPPVQWGLGTFLGW